jgi:hypothetical protein
MPAPPDPESIKQAYIRHEVFLQQEELRYDESLLDLKVYPDLYLENRDRMLNRLRRQPWLGIRRSPASGFAAGVLAAATATSYRPTNTSLPCIRALPSKPLARWLTEKDPQTYNRAEEKRRRKAEKKAEHIRRTEEGKRVVKIKECLAESFDAFSKTGLAVDMSAVKDLCARCGECWDNHYALGSNCPDGIGKWTPIQKTLLPGQVRNEDGTATDFAGDA